MKILLLTRNHVVREFVELVADRVGAELVVQDKLESVESGYDVLFVDDRGTLLEQCVSMLDNFDVAQSIVLYNQSKEMHDLFDLQIKKPFLPSDIQMILEETPKSKLHIEEDQILNIQDIDEIKSLLVDEDLEIVPEENLADEITGTPDFKSKAQIREEKLLEAMVQMEAKKIRKLLKGAEVTIHIRFPEEQE